MVINLGEQNKLMVMVAAIVVLFLSGVATKFPLSGVESLSKCF